MRGLGKLLIFSLTCSFGTYAQQPTSPPKHTEHQRTTTPRVVSIRFVTGAGFCGCYCGSEIQVSPGQATMLIRPFRECQQRDPQKYREFKKVDADLSNKHWHELEELVNHDALFGLPDTIGCPGCTDGPTNLVEVKFSDRTKKSVFYESAPSEIGALSEKLLALQAKLERELPPDWLKE